jgi:hypothetical protein
MIGQVCNLLYNCFWALPEQSLLGRSPAELAVIFYCLIWDSPTWRARSPYLYPPGTGWLSYDPRAHYLSMLIASEHVPHRRHRPSLLLLDCLLIRILGSLWRWYAVTAVVYLLVSLSLPSTSCKSHSNCEGSGRGLIQGLFSCSSVRILVVGLPCVATEVRTETRGLLLLQILTETYSWGGGGGATNPPVVFIFLS